MLGFARKALMNGGDCNEKILQERTSKKKREAVACPSYERLPDWNNDSDYSKGREWQHGNRTV